MGAIVAASTSDWIGSECWSREEMLADPKRCEALRAWDAGDDSALERTRREDRYAVAGAQVECWAAFECRLAKDLIERGLPEAETEKLYSGHMCSQEDCGGDPVGEFADILDRGE
jgi:hypothetical protein